MEPRRVLFVCTHNSARSQMAEGLLRFLGRGKFEAFSAGTEARAVRPEAIKVMAELGIDISDQESKTVERYLGARFDWVITVCDRAREACPVFPGADDTAHWAFDDPADAEGSEDERLGVFRRVRDEINTRMRMFVLAAGREDIAQPRPARVRQVAPLGALSQSWVSAQASLPLGWQISGLWRFDDLWVALAEGDAFEDYLSGSGRYADQPLRRLADRLRERRGVATGQP